VFQQHTKAAGLSLLLLLAAMASSAGEEPADELVTGTSKMARPDWTRLIYTGDDFPGKPTTTLELSESSMADMARAGRIFHADTFPLFTADHVRLLTVSAQGMGSGGNLRIWFDAASGAVLQRDRLKTGPGGSRKIYRYGPDGAIRVRLQPANSTQEQATPATWTQRKDKVFAYHLEAAGCSHVSVPALLLYTLPVSTPDLSGNYLCVFQDDTLYRVWPETRGRKPVPVDYTLENHGDRRQVTGVQDLEETGLRIEPVSGKQDATAFELLELRGEIAIYIDPVAGLPVRISGSRSLFRNINIRLSTVTMAE